MAFVEPVLRSSHSIDIGIKSLGCVDINDIPHILELSSEVVVEQHKLVRTLDECCLTNDTSAVSSAAAPVALEDAYSAGSIIGGILPGIERWMWLCASKYAKGKGVGCDCVMVAEKIANERARHVKTVDRQTCSTRESRESRILCVAATSCVKSRWLPSLLSLQGCKVDLAGCGKSLYKYLLLFGRYWSCAKS